MSDLAIIGGTGLATLKPLEVTRREVIQTPYGEPSAALMWGRLHGCEVVFLARHGHGHTLPPHQINYRANLWALHQVGVRRVIAVAAVGGIRDDMAPARLAIPDQIVDYTWGRAQTFFDAGEGKVTHIDFTHPYCEEMRQRLIAGCTACGADFVADGTYGATQGPRLETAAEIDRLERDGCHLVGMTGMPEAARAREIGICYATCAVIANRAAGRGGAEISMEEVEKNLQVGMKQVACLLKEILPSLV